MTLYEELGDDQLRQLLDYFYDGVFSDDRINFLFQNTEKEEIKRKQYLFLTQFLGGPMRYSQEFGHPKMRMRHLPHKITPSAAQAWLENMYQSIQKLPFDEDFKMRLYNRFPMVAAHMVNTPDSE